MRYPISDEVGHSVECMLHNRWLRCQREDNDNRADCRR